MKLFTTTIEWKRKGLLGLIKTPTVTDYAVVFFEERMVNREGEKFFDGFWYVFPKKPNGEIDETEMIAYAETLGTDKEVEFAHSHVRKKFQNRGIGGRLMDIREEYAKNNGCDKLSVTFTEDRNLKKRQRLFKRNGWKILPNEMHARKVVTPNATETHIFMPEDAPEFTKLSRYSLLGMRREVTCDSFSK